MRVRWTTPAADDLYKIVRHFNETTRSLPPLSPNHCTMAAET
jgi:hypothetical protein